MADLWQWLTQLENSKIVALVVLFIAYIAILIYIFTGKKRAERLESYKYIPLMEEDEDNNKQVKEDERSEQGQSGKQ